VDELFSKIQGDALLLLPQSHRFVIDDEMASDSVAAKTFW
jgi:hypothetical protein